MNYSLICMDIDGTLVNSESYVPSEVVVALKKISDKDIKLALVSGRYPSGVRLIEKQIGVNCIKASYAGGYIFDEDKCFYSKNLNLETALQVYDIARKNSGDCWFFCGENWFVTEMNDSVEKECFNVKARPEIVSIDKFNDICESKKMSPNKALVTGKNYIVKKISDEIKSYNLDIQLGYSSDIYLEVIPLGINKGMALEKICEINNINIENIIAFGDQDLDIPMIEKAGIGIAMGNAVDELKRVAKYITKTNNDAGIAYALEKILKII